MKGCFCWFFPFKKKAGGCFLLMSGNFMFLFLWVVGFSRLIFTRNSCLRLDLLRFDGWEE